MLANPPFRSFHKQLRIVIFVSEKSVERQTDIRPLFSYFFVTNCYHFFS